MSSLRQLNDELSLNPQKFSPPHTKTSLAAPPPPQGDPPTLLIGCPGCSYSTRVTASWSPYKLDRSHGFARVWYFGASCPYCKTPDGITERPFSLIRSQHSFDTSR